MLPPTAASRTSGTSWAGALRKYSKKCFHRFFRVRSNQKSKPLVSSMTAPFSLACFSETSTNHQIVLPHHRSTPPAPAYLSDLPQEHIPSSSLQSSPAGFQSVPTSHSSFTAVRLWKSPTWVNFGRRTVLNLKRAVCGRGEVIICITFHYSLRWPFIWTSACREMFLLACVTDAMSWQQNCLMPEHYRKTWATRLEGRLNYQGIVEIFTQQRHRRNVIFFRSSVIKGASCRKSS